MAQVPVLPYLVKRLGAQQEAYGMLQVQGISTSHCMRVMLASKDYRSCMHVCQLARLHGVHCTHSTERGAWEEEGACVHAC